MMKLEGVGWEEPGSIIRRPLFHPERFRLGQTTRSTQPIGFGQTARRASVIPTLRVSGAKRTPHLPPQGARPRDLDIAFGSLLSRFGIIPARFAAPDEGVTAQGRGSTRPGA